MKKINFLLLIISLIVLNSCDLTTDPDVGGTNVQEMSGEWFLQLKDSATKDVYVDYSLNTTSNDASNSSDKFWLIDHGSFWGFQSKMNANVQNFTFDANNSANILYTNPPAVGARPIVALGTIKKVQSSSPYKMIVSNGKISKGTFVAPSKTNTDFLSCLATGIYKKFTYVAESYSIVNGDTSMVWKITEEADEVDGPYLIEGYRRTGFLEDEH